MEKEKQKRQQKERKKKNHIPDDSVNKNTRRVCTSKHTHTKRKYKQTYDHAYMQLQVTQRTVLFLFQIARHPHENLVTRVLIHAPTDRLQLKLHVNTMTRNKNTVCRSPKHTRQTYLSLSNTHLVQTAIMHTPTHTHFTQAHSRSHRHTHTNDILQTFLVLLQCES